MTDIVARKLYHVHVKETGTDYYYTSVATIFENHNALGITYSSLQNYFRKKFNRTKYENDIVIIKKGKVIPKMSGKSRYFLSKSKRPK